MKRPQSLGTVHTHTHTGIFQLLRAKEKNALVLLNMKIKNNMVGENIVLPHIKKE